MEERPTSQNSFKPASSSPVDYSHADMVACVACYDNMKAAPRITRIEPAETNIYIEKLTTTIYEQASAKGGKIPYTAIREVSENFIHAQFKEIVVSILNDGNTIRFADQGPGIKDKERAEKPGFTSATQEMKPYIRGVGSGLPIVKEFMSSIDGYLTIEDNLSAGAVVTISLTKPAEMKDQPPREAALETHIAQFIPMPALSDKQKAFIRLLYTEGMLGVTDLSSLTDTSPSTTHSNLKKLEESGLIEITAGKKRVLTKLGEDLAKTL